ncbi:proline-rich protein 12-like [Protopterus annectens]|uniref:proline-rich protein 12-like n=1 Tax=Protopterus annectens TaxID=7888 RepID=UPI001CFB47A8|nr:proline-rich protein 12-like [Protopterus annectens]
MDRDYPTSSFTDPLVSATQPAVWAYERSTASVKPSLSYVTPDAAQTQTDLQRSSYATTHQLPGYTTTQPPSGISLSGIFDTSVHNTNNTTTDTSVLNLISALESRTPQAGSSAAALLPQFRTPSWQPGEQDLKLTCVCL